MMFSFRALSLFLAISAISLAALPTTEPTPLSRDQIAAIVQPYVDKKYVPRIDVGAFGSDDAGKPVRLKVFSRSVR